MYPSVVSTPNIVTTDMYQTQQHIPQMMSPQQQQQPPNQQQQQQQPQTLKFPTNNGSEMYQSYQTQQPMPQQTIHQAPMPMVQPMHMQQQQQQQQTQATNDAIVNHLIQQNANGIGSYDDGSGKSSKITTVQLHALTGTLKDVVMKHPSYEELARDFEMVRTMSLVDNLEYLETLHMNQDGFVNKKFFLMLLNSLYHKKYDVLFKKYPSLSIFLDFVLAKVVFQNEALLKGSCSSRTIRMPNNLFESDRIDLFFRKRSSKNSSINESSSADDGPTKKKRPTISLEKKHPFLSNVCYAEKPILFHIGRACEYLIPSEFACIGVIGTQQILSKHVGQNRTEYQGLRITFKKPVSTLIITKKVSGFEFSSLEHFANLGDCLVDYTGLAKMDDSFGYGSKKDMTWHNVETGVVETPNRSLDDTFNIVIVNEMCLFKMSNGTFACRSYANVVHILSNYTLSRDELDVCNGYISQNQTIREQEMEEFEQKQRDLEAEEEEEDEVEDEKKKTTG